MNLMKRLGLVASLVVGLTLFAASPAFAGKVALSVTGDLAPPVGAPEPRASGQWTFYFLDEFVTVSCRHLTPDTQYDVWHLEIAYTPVGVFYWWGCSTFTTDKHGRLNAQFAANTVDDLLIERLDEDGNCVIVLETDR